MIMGMGPVEAMRRARSTRAGLTLADLDVIELNEAFAVAVAGRRPGAGPRHGTGQRCARRAIALGHPIGASSARLLTTLVHALQARGGAPAPRSLCIGGWMGTAMVIEVA